MNARPATFGFRTGRIEAPEADTLPLADRVAAKILRRQAGAAPARIFVTCGAQSLTYAEADRRADKAANVLQRVGIAKGTRVAICLRNCLQYLDLWFGLSRLGAIQIPINTEYKSPQIAHVLKRAPVAAVVVDPEYLDQVLKALEGTAVPPILFVVGGSSAIRPVAGRAALRIADYDLEFERASDEPPAGADEVSGADAGVVMNTSGTTGPSKGVVLSHAQQYILGRMIAADMNLRDSDVYYNFFPLFHNTSQAMITIPVLLKGARMVLTERFSASQFWPDVRKHDCTAFYYIGEILRILVKSSVVDDATGTQLRVGWGIGASAADMSEFKRRYGTQMRTGYGSTEANVPVYLPHDSTQLTSCGRVAPGFSLRIANPNGEPVKSGEVGEILVRADEPCALMQGYDGDASATLAAWQDLWLHTGDAGRMDEQGNLYFMGRLKDSIRVRGENVSAAEVEQVIGEIQGVLEVAAIAVPCELGGDDLKIVVVLAEGAQVAHQDFIDYAQNLLPRFAVPRYVEIVASLPKTPTNKVQKHVLRASAFTTSTWDRQAQPLRRGNV